jgi:arylsulfatase A-like enzyme
MSPTRARFGALALALAACGGRAPPAPAAPRRVVLVVLDALRADRLGALGHPGALTPRLDALAAEGLFFERAYAASSFGPQACAALWSGRLPSEGGSTGIEAAPHPALVTLPRLFRRAGYRTALATNAPALRARGFTRGFDGLEVDSVAGRWNGERVTEKALELAEGAADGAFFLLVAYADAGEPHEPPAELRARIGVPEPAAPLTLAALRAEAGSLPPDLASTPAFRDLVARYEAEVAYVDRCLGRLVDGLAARGLLEGTLLVVTASHGLEFLEHGYVGSGWTLHEEVLRVPLVLWAPGRIAPERVPAPVSAADLLPSLQRLLAPPPSAPEQGARAFLVPAAGARLVPRVAGGPVLSELVLPELCVLRAAIQDRTKLVEVLRAPPPAERAGLLAGLTDHRARLRRGEVEAVDPLGPALRRELYDLALDPRETRDLAAGAPERVAALERALERYRELARSAGLSPAEVRAPAEEGAPALDELRQVGYL